MFELMMMTMAENIKPSIPNMNNVKEFMVKVNEYSQSDIADKFIVGTLLIELEKFYWSQLCN